MNAQNNLLTQMSKVPLVGGLAAPGLFSMEIASSINYLLEKDEEDDLSLQLAQTLWAKLNHNEQRISERGLSKGSDQFHQHTKEQTITVEQIRLWLMDENSLIRKILADETLRNSLFNKMGTVSAKFGAKLITRATSRIENKIETEREDHDGGGSLLVKEFASRNIKFGRVVAENLEGELFEAIPSVPSFLSTPFLSPSSSISTGD